MQRTLTRSQRPQAVISNGVNGHTSNTDEVHIELDALIVGAGFSGVYLLHRLRQEGFSAKIAEAGTALGGIWHWNSYPGARVDSQYPVYALSIPEVYKTWRWSEQYPGEKELKRYFQHVDKVLSISKDTLYEHNIVSAGWDPSVDKWRIQSENGVRITARFFLPCLGFAAKRHFPDWPGIDDYKGYICHSSFWPAEGVDMKDKRVGVVGTGATGIQISQEAARLAKQLTCFVRTANHCLPMNQGVVDEETAKRDIERIHGNLTVDRYINVAGMLYANPTKKTFDVPADVREAIWEEAWRLGGFRPLFCFTDLLTDEAANDEAYKFWAKKRRAQLTDPFKRDLLAPVTPVHPLGGKRPSLEQNYYVQMDKPHVTLVDVKKTPISHFEERGIVTTDGKLHELDIVVLATGFDAVTGGLKNIDITGLDGQRLADKWEKGTWTYLGMTVAGFPNMMFSYGPHSPTAYSNGPTIVERQDEFMVGVMKKMRDEGKHTFVANDGAEREWKQMISDTHAKSLRDRVDSWYTGANIPGKPREALNYSAGVPLYCQTLEKVLENDCEGFTLR